jgi:hypothetical protein
VEISRPNETTILLAGIDPMLADFLRRIPSSADPGDNEAAKARIFSKPTEDPEEDRFAEDWQEFVEPELAKLFQSALEVIDGDLKKLRPDMGTGQAAISIPSDHLESWIHGLNQARLVLTERHELHEEDLERVPSLAGDPRSMLLLQLHFYAEMQFIFLRLLEGR